MITIAEIRNSGGYLIPIARLSAASPKWPSTWTSSGDARKEAEAPFLPMLSRKTLPAKKAMHSRGNCHGHARADVFNYIEMQLKAVLKLSQDSL
ncbi:hypothetical protein L0Z42_11350 [Burkholderia multivorans]|uniref:hypothetical protein n=1 Tax=Burkholderia multivorans TaxID=87883 RepID=UPI0020191002|nr:hypothetical protein [Burkholderia multivorans]MCO1371140.1 hypothetical protein [Burkholderia multivorans]MCO1457606.1 hypothetical protein [Burkholderia multivorans]MCO1466595.1 hypothetical protein [Burkholderia multivorans]UQO15730.1 hypothetical protein L0Z02_08815 [Burkholderia multivorans]UQO86907.1 hypothetical protein L0Y86_17675 [Burkholderia multivorans]